ncbi:MAG: CoA-binding protein [Leptolinea sp.]|jgi:acetyltransferase|nr:CoA-binding protein [Leptolinea sp.]
MLKNLLEPKSIAVIGASEDVTKPGGRLTLNILTKGFAGNLYLVNPKGGMIQGVKAYPSIPELPEAPELALIGVPAKFVRTALEELAAKGSKIVVVLSAGFGELGPEGKAEERALAEIATRHGVLLLGPNCSGVMTYAHASKFTGVALKLEKGGIDFISGSGATVDFLAEHAMRRGLKFNSFLTVGNSAQSGVPDVMEIYDADHGPDSPKVMITYQESIVNPQKFLKAARSLNKKGVLLAGIKAGTTQAGSRAAASHTGAMATNDTAVQALFDKAGVIRVDSRLELVDVAAILTLVKGRADGRRVAIVTDAGGPGVMLSDELSRLGFEVPAFNERTRARLAEVLPAGAGVGNPVDTLPTSPAANLEKVLSILIEEVKDQVDYIVVMNGDAGMMDNWALYQVARKFMDISPIPIIPSYESVLSSEVPLKKFREIGGCYFEDEVYLARALSRVVNRPRIYEPEKSAVGYDKKKIAELLNGCHGALSPQITREVLQTAGVRFPGQVELREKAGLKDVPFAFPWVMKVMGPLHKSDVGGVRVGIKDIKEAEMVWDDLLKIKDASGTLVQQMVKGTEVIIGANREPGYGHLVAFGLGGIYTEALKDVKFALAPLAKEEADRLIHSIRSLPLLKGVRGEPGMDFETLRDILVRIGLLVTDFPAIQELDLNPVKGYGKDIFTVDARILVD